MRTALLCCLLSVAMCGLHALAAEPSTTAPATQPAARQEPVKSTVYDSFWSMRGILKHQYYVLIVGRFPDGKPKEPTSSQGTVKVQQIAAMTDLIEFQPSTVSGRMSKRMWQYFPKGIDPKRTYLMIMQCSQLTRTKTWPKANWNLRQSSNRASGKYVLAVPVDWPDPDLALAMRVLLCNGTSGDDRDTVGVTLDLIESGSREARNLALLAAANDSALLMATSETPDAPDRLCRLLLSADNPSVRAHLAMALSRARDDLIPREESLRVRLFAHKDDTIVDAALRNLRLASARQETLDGLLREILTSPDRHAHRTKLLRSLRSWGQKNEPYEKILFGIATNDAKLKPTPTDRVLALAMLRDLGADRLGEAVESVLADVPSAVAMDWAVDRERYDLAAAVVQAIQDDKYPVTSVVATGLHLLTGRKAEVWDSFEKWFSKLQADGELDEMVKTGFVGKDKARAARDLVMQLGSRSFEQRERARKTLLAGGQPVAPPLRRALNSADPEVALSARQILEKLDSQMAPARKSLQNQARREAQTGDVVGMPTNPAQSGKTGARKPSEVAPVANLDDPDEVERLLKATRLQLQAMNLALD